MLKVNRIFPALLCLLMMAFGAAAQDNPVATARAAGIYGLEPKFGNSTKGKLQRTVWERYGIYLLEHQNRAYVAGLKPGGAAAQQGAKIGDVLYGTDVMGASASLKGVLQGFQNVMNRPNGDGAILLYVYDGDSQWRREYRLTAAAPDGTVARIPPALRGASTSHTGLMAIIAGEPEQADPSEVTRDALLALQAISNHPKGCSGSQAVTIPVQIAMTTTRKDSRGLDRGSEVDLYDEELRVRPEFAPWARANISEYPVAPVSTVRSAVVDLIAQEGCDGAGFLQLEEGLARAMNVTLRASSPEQPTAPAGNFGDADAFISECYALSLQEARAAGKNPSERSTASICMCQEHAARKSGDQRLHSTIQVLDYTYWDDNPQMHDTFRADFDECWRAPDGSEFDQRARALWRRLGI